MEDKEARELEQRYQKLETKKPLLLKLDETIPWEEFRPLLEQVHDKPRKSKAGRKPMDVVVMFKMLVLQQLYNLSDEELEYQVNDRLSLTRFLGLTVGDSVPDGEIPDTWQQKPHRLSQKDIDARWTKKNGQSHFGYKNHISIDVAF
jgi:hypothetical protein